MAIYTGCVEFLTPEGDGALKDVRGCVVSIPGTLPGENVTYRVEHVSPHDKRVWASCCEVLSQSRERRDPPCRSAYPTRGLCGGCPLMHLSDKLQGELKQKIVLDALHNAKINYIHEVPFMPSPVTLGYRNRTDLVAGIVKGRPILGSYEPRTHQIVITRVCPILRSPITQAIEVCTNLMQTQRIPVYEFGRNMKGALRYVSFFANDAGDLLMDIVTSSDAGQTPAWVNPFAFAMKNAFVLLKGVSYSLNDSANNAIRVAPSKNVWGEATLVEHYGSIETRLSASGFTQLNSDMAAHIYRLGREWLGYRPDVLWDLYCGTGCFGRMIAPLKHLFGAEFNARAIEIAKNVSQNDAFNTSFEVMDLENQWPEHWPEPNVILVDPPRKGLSQCVLEHLAKLQHTTILYMSCYPTSFAKNIAYLDPHYEIEKIAAFDMMPQTRHVEVLALLKPRRVK